MRFADLWRSRIRNLLHSALLVGGMVVLLCMIGQLFAGTTGLVFLGVVGGFLLLFSPRFSPRLILRMYRAERLSVYDAPYLVSVVEELSARARLPTVPQLYYFPSQMVNAFALGTRGDATIGVTDGLLRALNKRELTGVLAHELGHVRSNDIWVMGIADLISRMTNTLSFVGQFLLFVNLPLLLMGRSMMSWGAILLLIFAPTLTALLQLALARTREYDADLGAVELSGDPRGLASALAKLDRLSAGLFERILLPGRRIPEPSLFRTHPPTDDRIRRLLALEGELDTPRERLPAHFQELSFVDTGRVLSAMIRLPRWHLTGLWY